MNLRVVRGELFSRENRKHIDHVRTSKGPDELLLAGKHKGLDGFQQLRRPLHDAQAEPPDCPTGIRINLFPRQQGCIHVGGGPQITILAWDHTDCGHDLTIRLEAVRTRGCQVLIDLRQPDGVRRCK